MPAELTFACGTSEQPLLFRTVGDMLELAAERRPNHEALVVRHQGARYTYRELNDQVDMLARGLLGCGLKPGDRVGIWSPNNLQWVITLFATARAGLILVNINPAYRITELEYALGKVGCRMLIVAPSFKSSNYVEMIRSLLAGQPARHTLPQLEFLVHLGKLPVSGFLSFDELCEAGAGLPTDQLKAVTDGLDADHPVNLQ